MIDLFAPGAASVLVHVGVRLGGLVAIAPVFSARNVPVKVRTALLCLLAALLHGTAMASVTQPPRISAGSLAAEALIGFAIGLGAALFVGAAEAAGDYISMQMGLAGAAVMDPTGGHQVPVLGQFLQLITLVTLLSFDAHLAMLRALADSLAFLPVGGEVDLGSGLRALVAAGGMLFSLGMRFAAPIIAAMMIANAALAVLGRAAPQMNLLSVAFPLHIGIGLILMAAVLPLMAAFFVGWDAQYESVVTRLLGSFSGAAGGN